MLQYKVLEMGVSSEIGNIQKAQLELEMLKAEFKEVEDAQNDEEDEDEEAEPAESPETKQEEK